MSTNHSDDPAEPHTDPTGQQSKSSRWPCRRPTEGEPNTPARTPRCIGCAVVALVLTGIGSLSVGFGQLFHQWGAGLVVCGLGLLMFGMSLAERYFPRARQATPAEDNDD